MTESTTDRLPDDKDTALTVNALKAMGAALL
jgi:hypothetical protein